MITLFDPVVDEIDLNESPCGACMLILHKVNARETSAVFDTTCQLQRAACSTDYERWLLKSWLVPFDG